MIRQVENRSVYWRSCFFNLKSTDMTDPSDRSSFFARHFPWIVAIGILVVMLVITLNRSDLAAKRNNEVEDAAAVSMSMATASRPEGAVPRRRPASLEDSALIANRRAEQRKNVQETVDSTQKALTAQFRNEKIDAAWAPSKERALAELSTSDQIKSLKADISNLSVDCKTTVCRVTGDFPSMVAGDDWFTLYMNNVAPEIPYASYKYVPNADGTVRIEVYAAGRK